MLRIWTIAAILSIVLTGCGWFGSSEKKLTTAEESRRQTLQRQIETKYENPQAHFELGKLYHADGILERAEWHYRIAIGFDPVLYPAQVATVKVLRDMQNKAKSETAAQLYIDQASVSAEASLRLGRAFQGEGYDDYAITCYQQAARLAPNSAVVFRQKGFYYLNKGDRVRAEENFRRSIQLDPYQTDVASELGRMGVVVQIPRKETSNRTLQKAVQD